MNWRVGLVVVALLVQAGVLVLLWQADAALVRAEVDRHRLRLSEVVAGMENHLAMITAREESRPFHQYRYFTVPTEMLPGSVALTRSPLAPWPPEQPVLCYLQVDPDGQLRSPHRPADEALARQALGWTPDPALDLLLSNIGAQLQTESKVVADEAELAVSEAAPAAAAPRPPDETDAVEEIVVNVVEVERDDMEAARNVPMQQQQESVPASMSKFGKLRASRRETAPAQALYSFDQAESNIIAEQLKAQQPDAARNAPLAPKQVADAVRQRFQVDPEVELSAAIDALQGRLLSDDRLLLRQVQVADRQYQQGLVLDLVELRQQLGVLLRDDTDLAAACALDWSGADRQAGAYQLRHRFTAPFEALQVTLSCSALPQHQGWSRGLLWSLGVAVIAVGLLGLVTAERLITARLGYARRRQQFVAAVSHELKTPLTSIRMYAEMLRNSMVDGDEKRQEYYQTIHAESERLSRLIGNVLALGRLEQGTCDVRLQCGELAPVLSELQAILQPALSSQGFRLEIQQSSVGSALFDREILLQILVNVCDNALKYAANGTDKVIHIEASLLQQQVCVRIRDHGPGVAPDHLPRLFEAFYRGEDEETRRHPGSGIGLALVRGLAERMQARVQARNHPEGGFELRLTLASG